MAIHKKIYYPPRKWGTKKIAPGEENPGAASIEENEKHEQASSSCESLRHYHTAGEDHSQEKIYKMDVNYGYEPLTWDIILRRSTYQVDNSLAIMMYKVNDGAVKGPWGVLTVNLSAAGNTVSSPDAAFVDTNNNGEEIMDFIIQNGIGEPTGRYGHSGWCTYPEVKFNINDIKEYDPKEDL